MQKYLFTDGTSGVKELQSDEELSTMISSSTDPEKIKIWVFNTNEWVSYKGFASKKPLLSREDKPDLPVVAGDAPARPVEKRHWLKKFLFFIVASLAIFLVYNFTRIKWEKAGSVNIIATRPVNTPLMDIDSLIQVLEYSHGQPLDRITRTNLRIRNSWPDRILLQLDASRDTSSAGSRYYDIELTIDNATGYNLDQAIVKLTAWKNSQVSSSDTFRFNNISYALAAKRKLKSSYRGDSLSLSFQSIKAKVFNFCYSADKKSNYGNNNDRWFCRE